MALTDSLTAMVIFLYTFYHDGKVRLPCGHTWGYGAALNRLVSYSSVLVLVAKAAMVLVLSASLLSGAPADLRSLSQVFYLYIFPYSLVHMFVRLGARRGVLFFSLAFFIPAAMELLGAGTGLIFGDYYYTDLVQPQLFGAVPLGTISYWRFGLYGAYAWAYLVFRPDRERSVKHRLAAAAAGAAALTMLDLSIDPVEMKKGAWVWKEAGSYFGIPLQNFLGWFVTGFLVLGLFLLLAPEPSKRSQACRRGWVYHLPAIDIFSECLYYLLLSVSYGVIASGCIGAAALVPLALLAIKRYRDGMRAADGGGLTNDRGGESYAG